MIREGLRDEIIDCYFFTIWLLCPSQIIHAQKLSSPSLPPALNQFLPPYLSLSHTFCLSASTLPPSLPLLLFLWLPFVAITVNQKDTRSSIIKSGKLVLVDLAGSEMVRPVYVLIHFRTISSKFELPKFSAFLDQSFRLDRLENVSYVVKHATMSQ